MKRFTQAKQSLFVLALLVATAVPATGFSQDDYGFEDDVLTSEDMDIDGEFRRKGPTEAEKLERLRDRLEKKNEFLVKKKIEDVRMNAERKLTKDLRNMFNGKPLGSDQVSTKAAAPVKKVEAVVEETNAFETFKIIPTAGVRNFNGANGVNYTSKVNTGLAVESMVSRQFSVGLTFNYTQMGIKEYDASRFFGAFVPLNPRKMNYRNTSLGLQSKFFLITERKIKPYIGGGIDYNMARLRYDDTFQSFQTQSAFFPQEEPNYSANYMSGRIFGGAEVNFSDSVGALLELSYSKNISNTENRNVVVFPNRDQDALNALGKDISEASALSINAGLVLTF